MFWVSVNEHDAIKNWSLPYQHFAQSRVHRYKQEYLKFSIHVKNLNKVSLLRASHLVRREQMRLKVMFFQIAELKSAPHFDAIN